MRVAFVGKGGAGKSAVSGTFARLLARTGRSVLAIDSDPLPGMAFSLGLPHDDAPLPDEAIEDRPEDEEGPRYRLRAGLSAVDAVERYAATAPDGVRFLQFGKVRTDPRALFRSQFAFRQIIRDLPVDRWDLVGDLPVAPASRSPAGVATPTRSSWWSSPWPSRSCRPGGWPAWPPPVTTR
jgi:CO dehydrogenase maturation factor